MSLELFNQIVQAGTILTIISLILCLYRFPKRSLEIKFQVIGLLGSVLASAYVEIFNPRGLTINIPASLNLLPAMLAPMLMFNAAMKGKYQTFTLSCAVLFSVFAVWNFVFGQRINFNSYTSVLGGALVILHCIMYYYYLMVNLPVQRLSRLPMFWFTIGYLVYYGGALFITAAVEVEAFQDSLLVFWTIKNLLRIAQMSFIIVGLIVEIRSIRTQTSVPSPQ